MSSPFRCCPCRLLNYLGNRKFGVVFDSQPVEFSVCLVALAVKVERKLAHWHRAIPKLIEVLSGNICNGNVNHPQRVLIDEPKCTHSKLLYIKDTDFLNKFKNVFLCVNVGKYLRSVCGY